jgi:enoyl-CoA hydratase/carnithine racemase
MTDVNIRAEIDADGVLLARIDMPGRAMNVFSKELMDSLERIVTRAETDPAILAVVLTSGKPAFLAGADLEMIKIFTERARSASVAELNQLFGYLGRLFRRLELSKKPYVAAINGLALGGGLELCLACHRRVVADDPSIQLGLPEVKLGLLPGAGGTQRLPRVIGPVKGLQMLLTGEAVPPETALALGLVEAVVPADSLIAVAKQTALDLAEPLAPWDRPGAHFDSAPYDFGSPEAFAAIARSAAISDYQLLHYPAYRAIMECVVGGWSLPMSSATEHEMSIFVALMRDPVAGNMVRTLFLNRQKAAKLGLLGADSPLASDANALIPRVRSARERAAAAQLSEEELLLAAALAAVQVWGEGRVEQPGLADVAIVSTGLFPSYAGGPFTYIEQRGLPRLIGDSAAASAKDAELFTAPAALTEYFASPSRVTGNQ